MAAQYRDALRVSWATIAWSSVTGVISIVVAISAASLALLGSGAGVLIDVSSSCVLVWRFNQPLGHDHAERRATIAAASALTILAVLLIGASIQRLISGGHAHPNTASIVVAAASTAVLPLLATMKYIVAARVPSRALRTDAHITVVGATTAALTLVGLALTNAGHPSADAIAALIVGGLAAVVGAREFIGGV